MIRLGRDNTDQVAPICTAVDNIMLMVEARFWAVNVDGGHWGSRYAPAVTEVVKARPTRYQTYSTANTLSIADD